MGLHVNSREFWSFLGFPICVLSPLCFKFPQGSARVSNPWSPFFFLWVRGGVEASLLSLGLEGLGLESTKSLKTWRGGVEQEA